MRKIPLSLALRRLRANGTPTRPLEELAAVANREHNAARESLGRGIDHAIEAGSVLILAKARFRHGQWMPWLATNCPDISARMAQRYMRVAANATRVSHLSQREALKLLAEPSENVHFSSKSEEWYTPQSIIDPTVRLLGAIDLDPCGHADSPVPAVVHFTAAQDGLSRKWSGRVYMNAPYGRRIEEWVEKLCAEYASGAVTEAIALVPARTETEWFTLFRDFPVCYVRGRLKFSGHKNAAPFPSAVVYLGRNIDKFALCFGGLGDVRVPVEWLIELARSRSGLNHTRLVEFADNQLPQDLMTIVSQRGNVEKLCQRET